MTPAVSDAGAAEGLGSRFTQRFEVRHPILLAPMAGETDGRMAAAVSAAGGLGSFGATNPFQPDGWVAEQIDQIRVATSAAFAVGFITPSLERSGLRFDLVLERSVPVIVLSFSDPQPWLTRAHEAGCKVICQIQTIQQAVRALDQGADALVAQGTESGGHTGRMGVLALLAAVLRRCPDIPVLAAGGVGDARSLAAVMAAGADGASMGTAFLASKEAPALPLMKELIVHSDGSDTVWTRAYDIVLGLSFPDGIGARVHANAFTRRWEGREHELIERRKEVASNLQPFAPDRPDEAFLMYGQSAAFVNDVRPISEIMAQLTAHLAP
jgi:nitronate monooxygenase